MEAVERMPGTLKRNLRRCLLKLGIKTVIQEYDYVDPVTGQKTYLTVTHKYAVLSSGDQHWYFDRYRRA